MYENMHPNWMSLIPPFIVIMTAFATQRINLSLFLGILSAGFTATYSYAYDVSSISSLPTWLLDTCKLLSSYAYKTISSPNNIYLALFLLGTGVLISLFNHTGAALALIRALKKKIKTAYGAQICTMATSCLLSLDDYLSILTTGYTMRPITDQFGVHPLRLALLVHTFAGPLVILTPFSSWIGIITTNMETASLSANSFCTYLASLPFIFYSPFALFSAWYIARRNIQFSFLKKYESRLFKSLSTESYPYSQPDLEQASQAILDQNHQSQSPDINQANHTNQTLSDLLLPLGILISMIIFGILYSGDSYLCGGTRTLMDCFLYNKNSQLIMCVAIGVSLLIAFTRALFKKQISLHVTTLITKEGVMLTYGTLITIFLAMTFSDLLNSEIFTGKFLAHALLGYITPILLPPLCFLASLLIALITGSAWGTFTVMLPTSISMTLGLLHNLHAIALPTTLEAAPLVLIVIGAVLSGAVCGNHISLFAETTIMTATSTQTDPFEHAYTQAAYMIPAIVCTFLAFSLAGVLITMSYGLMISTLMPSALGLGLCALMLELANHMHK